ncbi:MAG: DEAD/DEAH box helicase [Spirochaetales bacterium]|nr:DEAD/DEAH box helicase [Spirochaetales bacterium]
MLFSELNLHQQVLDGTIAAKFEFCMPVQEKVLPISIEGSDVMVQSKTGSGKTAVYVITFLEKYLRSKEKGINSSCLIIAPTRELAQQISEDAIKKRIASVYLFDSYGLKLTDAEYNSIDRMIAGIKASVDGEKGIEEDEVFKALGMKTDDLRTVLITDSKVGALQDHLYGEEGVRKITDDQRETYYNDNYYRFKLLYLMDGDFVRDENGEIEYNESGNAKVTPISDERYEEKLDLAKDILAKVRAGEDIDKYIEEYSDQLEKDDYKNGHYLCSVNEYGTLLSGAVMKLSVGETGLLDTKYGIYVIQRIELDPGAWGKEENEAGNDFYNFEQLVLEKEFDDYLAPHMEKIEVNRAVTDKYKMEELPYTFSWQYIF